jgi:hypothetical protein
MLANLAAAKKIFYAPSLRWNSNMRSPKHGARHTCVETKTGSHSVDCLNAKLPESLKAILHGLERFGRMALPI